MAQLLFQTAEGIDKDLLSYIENKAQVFRQFDKYTNENILDIEALNPAVQDYLENVFAKEESDIHAEGFAPQAISVSEFALSFEQGKALEGKIVLLGWWKRFKEKIRRIFCTVVGSIGGEDGFDWKTIISAVLVALIPAFASGVPAIALPVVVALVASLMKYGYDSICPA